MENSTLKNAKLYVDKLLALGEQVISDHGIDLDSNTIKSELSALCCFVAGADDKFSKEEIDLLNYLFDMDFTSEFIRENIEVLAQMYDTLTTQPGPGFLVYSILDGDMGNKDGTTLYITVIKMILDLFAEIDGHVDASETEFINDYIAMLERHQ